MSQNSKARRDARRRTSAPRPFRRLGDTLQILAQLTDPAGETLAAVALRDGEWRLLLDGTTVATTDSAAMALAMLRHVGQRHQAGTATGPRLRCSPRLRALAADEAAAQGRTLDAHLDALEAERRERHAPPATA